MQSLIIPGWLEVEPSSVSAFVVGFRVGEMALKRGEAEPLEEHSQGNPGNE
jgi:hypothetical protein